MSDDSTQAVLAAIETVLNGVDDLRSRMDGMVTRAEHVAEMRQVNGRLDRVQASVKEEREERVTHVRGEREARQAAVAAEETARLAAAEAANTRFWRVVGASVATSSVLVGAVTWGVDHLLS